MSTNLSYGWGKYGTALIVLFSLALALMALSAVMKFTFGERPAALIEASKRSAPILHDAYRRVAGVQKLNDLSSSQDARSFVFVLGLSTVRIGFDGQWLAAQTPKLPWLIFGGSGGSFDGLSYYVQAFTQADSPRPELTIVGVHPAWMAGLTSIDLVQEESLGDAYSAAIAGDMVPVKNYLKNKYWSLRFDNSIGMLFEILTLELQNDLLNVFNIPLHQRFEPRIPPWLAEETISSSNTATREMLENQLSNWKKMGMFDTKRYVVYGQVEGEHFANLLRQLDNQSKRLVVVYLPEHSKMRVRVPALAAPMLEKHIATVNSNITILDLRAELSDEYFFDNAHLNRVGQRNLSVMLLERLNEHGMLGD